MKKKPAVCVERLHLLKIMEKSRFGEMEYKQVFCVDECVEATIRLMRSDFSGPVNIGSDEMISINDLAKMVINISNKKDKN